MTMECFVVYRDEIEGRIDPFYYKPEFREIDRKIKQGRFKVKRFNELNVEIRKGIFNLHSKDYKKEGVPFIRISNIEDGTLNFKDIVFISEDDNEKEKRTQLLPGDLVFSKIGTIDRVGIIPYKFKRYNMSQNIIGVKLKNLNRKEIDPQYLRIFFLLEIGKIQLKREATFQVQPKLTLDGLRKIKIILPPLQIQNHIVQLMNKAYSLKKQKETEARQLLDSINDYVLSELGIKLPQLKDQMTFVVYAEDVKCGRLDPYYYQPKFKEVGKAIERGKFEVKKLRELLEKFVSGQRPKGGVRQIKEGIPSLGGEHILDDGTITTSDLKYIPIEFHKKQLKSKVKKKDILLVKDGATTGKIGIIPEDYPFEEANINEHVFLLRVKKEINPYYVFSILKSPIGQMQIKRNITGGTIMGIIRETTEKIKIPLPPLEIQNKIAEEVKRRMEKAEQLQKEAKEVLERAKQEVENIILNGESHEN